ncbi:MULTISPECIES: fimbria/pilus outer membrane usher protein [unclassified Pseudomonas]|nr:MULTISPECIES: fimbria/pilus outer membrane usher protein [unclassified Pseudomonas]NWC91052.1 fimbrial biogenesis outer membrane usher protein [Pseudomonas sp. IPO3779]NWD16531.1 fimbrial biogenesis outer membrane usher protein [Pseudomonas sp. IPO3778]
MRLKATEKNFIKFIYLVFFQLLSCAFSVKAEDGNLDQYSNTEFNPTFLQDKTGRSVDLTMFSKKNYVIPGSYSLDVFVNNERIGRKTVTVLEATRKKNRNLYCFEKKQISNLGIDFNKLSIVKKDSNKKLNSSCVFISELVPNSSVEIDIFNLKAFLTIPQAYLQKKDFSSIDPKEWKSGINAGFLDYSLNSFDSESGGSRQSQFTAGLTVGLNYGEWRLRHNGSYNKSQIENYKSTSTYDAISSYAQRDVTGIKSQLTVGEYYTASDLFDSVPYTGFQIASDDRMLPDSQRGFAPTIRGVAQSNAQVTVRQGESIIYQSSVPPGPFVIDQLFSTGYAGDLDVSIVESDGRSRTFTVPYSSAVQLLRPGTTKFNITGGRYRGKKLENAPYFMQSTLQRGLSDTYTGYLGSIFSEDYFSGQAGVAVNTKIGSLALDITHSRASFTTRLDDGTGNTKGNSYRITYNKIIELTKTNFTVASYRFSSPGYMSFADFAARKTDESIMAYPQRSRAQLNISQPLGRRLGSIYITGSAQNYWNKSYGSDVAYQAGYSNAFNWGSMDVSASRARSNLGIIENEYTLSLSIPLGGRGSTYLHTSVNYSDQGSRSIQNNISGTIGDEADLNYGLYAGKNIDEQTSDNSHGVNLQYQNPYASYMASYSAGSNYNQKSIGVNGSFTAYSDGISFSRQQGETRVLIQAEGAEGAKLSNTGGGVIGKNGFGVVSNLMPYRENQVSINPRGISENVELDATSQAVVPRYGSIVKLKFSTKTGAPVILKLNKLNGGAIPVGSEVKDIGTGSMTWIGQEGRLFLRVSSTKGTLQVKWGQRNDEKCLVNYEVSTTPRKGDAIYPEYNEICI